MKKAIALLSVLAGCERYAQQLDGQEPLEPSFLSILGERLDAASSEAPAVQTPLDSCPGSWFF